jgi:hypothetical protein
VVVMPSLKQLTCDKKYFYMIMIFSLEEK